MNAIVFAHKLRGIKAVKRKNSEIDLMRDLDSRVCDEYTLKELNLMIASSHIPMDKTITQKSMRRQGREN